MKKNLQFYLKKAIKQHFAIGAFNFFNLESLQAINKASIETKSPIIIAVSESSLDYMGDEFVVSLAQICKKSNPHIFLHLDHGSNFKICKKAIDLGFDSVMFDGSLLPFEENIKQTKKVVSYAHKRGVLVEGEVGKILGTEDNVLSKETIYTTPQAAYEFVKRTQVDMLAVSIGTAHGINKHSKTSKLRFDLLTKIEKVLPNFPLVLHGASTINTKLVNECNKYGGKIENFSGIEENQIIKAIKEHNIVKINTDTDIRLAFTSKLRKFLTQHPEDIDVRKMLIEGKREATETIKYKIEKIFDSKNKK